MRIYFDSNIFRRIRKDSKTFNAELYESVKSLREAFLFIFSDAHLVDLSSSDSTYRDKDLQHMEEYVGKNFFSFDQVHKKFHISLATPSEAYANTNYHLYNRVLDDPFEALENLLNEEEAKIFKPFLDNILNLPLPPVSDASKEFSTSASFKMEEPLKEVRTLRDLIAEAGGMLTDKNEFAAIQSIMFNYINRDDYSFDAWSFDFDEKMKATAIGKTFTEMVNMTCAGLPKEDTYNRFINFYTFLEFFGVTQERSGGKRKKNSMQDLHKDAAHAYFASNTDYFVSDDKGVLSKAFIAYRMFDINTEVLSINDFMTKCGFLLKNEEDLSSLFRGLRFSLKSGFVMEHSSLTDHQLIKLPYQVLNYFDRLQVDNISNSPSLLLFRSPKTSHGIMWAEFDLLLSKCIHLFGMPTDKKERLHMGEYNRREGAHDRRWSIANAEVILDFGRTSSGESVILLQIIFGD